jgi:putative SOS response-associated peptidase YedK
MCGRYTLRRIEQIVEAMLAMPELDDFYLTPYYNIAPSQQVPIVRREDRGRVLDRASWGFVPSWAKGKVASKPEVRPWELAVCFEVHSDRPDVYCPQMDFTNRRDRRG